MTTAACIYCGNLKFGAFVPCQHCDRVPTVRTDVVRSLLLTDHYFTHEELSNFGNRIKNGEKLDFDVELEQSVAEQVDDGMLDKLVRLSDPAYREHCRKRERIILLVILTAMIGGIAWMLYRFAVR